MDQISLQTPLREGLKVLASEGLVVLTPNRGASVTDADLHHGFPVMAALEALAGELACRSITDEEIERIEALQRAMRECFERSDLNGYFRIPAREPRLTTDLDKLVRAAAPRPCRPPSRRGTS